MVGSQLNSTIYTQDAMSCAMACTKEMNCYTANYIKAEKKCELFGEQTEDVFNSQAAIVFLKGCFLIKKIQLDAPQLQDTPDPVASLAWLDFTPQWCTLSGRASFGGEKITAEQCKEKCKDGCLGVEWWEKSRSCYECADPSKKTAYKHTNDKGYPPHVFLKI
ncbi:uncharacterized protein [Porites lutea]|uniref:uncharacterized protein n=1 Tax=Porites lutea TaxID=51062 RepID=UPI003CC6D4D6